MFVCGLHCHVDTCLGNASESFVHVELSMSPRQHVQYANKIEYNSAVILN